MRLSNLLAGLDVLRRRGDANTVTIEGVTCHSAQVSAGDVFVCIRGHEHDGHQFIPEAVLRGAAALIVDEQYPWHMHFRTPPTGDSHPPVIQVKDTRYAYARLCAAVARDPTHHLHVTGITGTNGKTTTALFLDAIYRAAGLKTGLVTTVFSRIGERTLPQKLTTPEAGTLQTLLGRMRRKNVDRVILETSSHALQMQRVAGTVLQTAVFTNLTRDHLDYHRCWDEYRRAKGRIFSLLDERTGIAVLNIDDASGRGYRRLLGAPSRLSQRLENGGSDPIPRTVVTYSMRRPADVGGQLLKPSGGSTSPTHPGIAPLRPVRLRITTPGGRVTVPLVAPAAANAYNALAAAATAWAQGISLRAISLGLTVAEPPPGRFQEVAAGQPFRVYVDFAHNPTALAHALAAVRAELHGRLHLVFGCKGDDADEWKRRLMGRIAARYADEIVVTTDNPFGECPEHIAAVVARGVAEAGVRSCSVTLDRSEAIGQALERAEPGDAVFIAGRGHEQRQHFGSQAVALDDANVVTRWLQDRYERTPKGGA